MHMDVQKPIVRYWDNGGNLWKGKRVFLGFEVIIDGSCYYLFIGKNGRGNKDKRIPLYCELSMPEGQTGRIMMSLGSRYDRFHTLLHESLKPAGQTYYIFKSFEANEYEKACLCLRSVLQALSQL